MLDPTSINLAELPSFSLKQRSLLPTIAGIYFAIDSQGIVQYIGRSVNLRQRWGSHHRHSELEKIGDIRIAWLEISDCSLLEEVEKALIEWFAPYLNWKRVATTEKLLVHIVHKNSLANLSREGRPKKRGSDKKHRRLSVTDEGWNGCKKISDDLGISVSEILESLGRGEFILSKPINSEDI